MFPSPCLVRRDWTFTGPSGHWTSLPALASPCSPHSQEQAHMDVRSTSSGPMECCGPALLSLTFEGSAQMHRPAKLAITEGASSFGSQGSKDGALSTTSCSDLAMYPSPGRRKELWQSNGDAGLTSAHFRETGLSVLVGSTN